MNSTSSLNSSILVKSCCVGESEHIPPLLQKKESLYRIKERGPNGLKKITVNINLNADALFQELITLIILFLTEEEIDLTLRNN